MRTSVAFYKEKQKRLTGSEDDYVKSIRVSPAEGTSTLVCDGHDSSNAFAALQ